MQNKHSHPLNNELSWITSFAIFLSSLPSLQKENKHSQIANIQHGQGWTLVRSWLGKLWKAGVVVKEVIVRVS